MEQPTLVLPLFRDSETFEQLATGAQLDKALIISSMHDTARQLLNMYKTAHPWTMDVSAYMNHFCRSGSAERTEVLIPTALQLLRGMTCHETGQTLSDMMDGSLCPVGNTEHPHEDMPSSIDHLVFDDTQLRQGEQELVSDFMSTNNLLSIDLAILRAVLRLGLLQRGECNVASFSLEVKLLSMYLLRHTVSQDPMEIDRVFWHFSRAVLCCPEDFTAATHTMFELGKRLHLGRNEFKRTHWLHLAVSFENLVFLLQTDNEKKARVMDFIAGLYCAETNDFHRHAQLNEVVISLHERAAVLSTGGRTDSPEWIAHLGWHYQKQFVYLGNIADASRAVTYLTQANTMAADSHSFKATILYYLCKTLSSRFEYSGNILDLDDAIAYQVHGISLPCCNEEDRPECMLALGNAYSLRYGYLEESSDLEFALQYRQEHVLLTPQSDAAQTNLGLSYMSRYNRKAILTDLDNAIACQLKSISLLELSDDPAKPVALHNTAVAYLARFNRLKNSDDPETALGYQLQAVQLRMNGPPALQAKFVSALGSLYFSRYKEYKAVEDINEAVRFFSQAKVLTVPGHVDRCHSLSELGECLSNRYKSLGQQIDLEESISNFHASALAVESPPRSRFDAAFEWAKLCALHESIAAALPAYGVAMNLLPQIAWLGASTSWRYNRILSKGNVVIEAAAAAVRSGAYTLALEWLEQGRSIVWKQLLQLRTPLEDLHDLDHELADGLKNASRVLASESQGYQALNWESSLGSSAEQAAHRRRRVAQEWEKLVEKARQLPGFGDFMQPANINELVRSASSSTVVVLFVHNSGCTALVIRRGARRVEHVSLPCFSHQKATLCSKRIKNSLGNLLARGSERKITNIPEGGESQNHFQSVLTTLWFEVVHPVLVHLGFTTKSDINELPRITWCCTGPTSFLPLHAAGDYTATGSGARVFHHVISSYTPTLTSLIPRSDLPPTFTGILAVSQSQTSGEAALPGATEELERIKELAAGLPFTQIRDEEATDHTVLTGMTRHGWVHLACHASQNLTEPQNSAFRLHGSVLSLRTITEQQIPAAEFAFLSACQTATGDESVPDEAVHLAAGMLMTGYKTVIATMWSIRDEDAPLVAEYVYYNLLKGGMPDSKRASVALHEAVAKLRERVGEENFAAWLPYIHLGQ